ncbi:MAG: hypothetical protein KBD01_01165 [Acidobacteria bacterium]|nr:hypothetical protein [Acidobacteriota bacterium]
MSSLSFANDTHQAIARDEMHRVAGIGVTGPREGAPAQQDSLWASGAYAYDGRGQIVAIGQQSFVYDRTGRLESARLRAQASQIDLLERRVTFQYDIFGNMTSRQFDESTGAQVPLGFEFTHTFPGGGNQVGTDGTREFDYDENGNLRRFRGQLGQTAGAVWDERGRMRGYVEGDAWAGDRAHGGRVLERGRRDRVGQRRDVRGGGGRAAARGDQLPAAAGHEPDADGLLGAADAGL